tara:strand:- start:21790 stop:22212 length:423 start_codon:yes stop_codon:yes gene_type:complete
MYLNQKKYTPAPMIFSKQKGLGLPVALFIIIIMSIIAVAVNRINESSSQSYGQNILSLRAFYAAESGAQLRAKDALSVLPCTCGSSPDLVYDFSVKGLNQCRAATNCTSFSVNGNTYCTIKSIGRCDNANAERTVEVRLK